MRAIYSALICLLLAQSAAAQDWFMRDGDITFSATELSDRLLGQTLRFYDDGQSHYGEDESYTYTYLGGDSAHGQFKIMADSIVCVEFANGFDRCDRFVENAGRLILVTADHQRFPIREVLTGPPVFIAEP